MTGSNAPRHPHALPDTTAPLNVMGLMSGTSVDGIDIAMLTTDGITVGAPGPRGGFDYLPQEQAEIRAAFGQQLPSQAAIAAVTTAHIRAIDAFLTRNPEQTPDLIGFHGQTTFHDPARRLTVQIGDAQALANRYGVPVVADFRKADVAAGGEGAPFAPLFHVAMTDGLPRPLAVLNLGGVGNVTWIGNAADDLLAFDTGPANALIDDWMMQRTGASRDDNGQAARAGQVNEAWLVTLMDNAYFTRPPPKSLDREDFRPDRWPDGVTVDDGAATLTEFTARSVAMALPHLPQPPLRWLVTGGGRHNPTLMRRLSVALDASVEQVEAIGHDGDAVEAQAFAFLAMRSLRCLPLSVPGTTNVPKPMTGGRLVMPE
ncbi:MAG: anhydro-N-acetylmuramic acid kinase [Minwuia sp.]|nr:anhydro-N-acetylmuramic acid kinase [Minwuia sp.]